MTQPEILYLLTKLGENTGQSLIRPGSFTAQDVLSLIDKLREMRE